MNRGLDLTNEAHSRTMRDFLEVYNKITNHCFEKCISNFNHREVSPEEARCVSACTDKFLAFNQRHMLVFMEHQVQKQKLAALAAESATESQTAQGDQGAAAVASAGVTNVETPSAETPVTSPTDVRAEEPASVTQAAT